MLIGNFGNAGAGDEESNDRYVDTVMAQKLVIDRIPDAVLIMSTRSHRNIVFLYLHSYTLTFTAQASTMLCFLIGIPLAYLYCLKNPNGPYEHIHISDQSVQADIHKQVKRKRKAMKKAARNCTRLGASVTSHVTSSPSPSSSPVTSLPSYRSREL